MSESKRSDCILIYQQVIIILHRLENLSNLWYMVITSRIDSKYELSFVLSLSIRVLPQSHFMACIVTHGYFKVIR